MSTGGGNDRGASSNGTPGGGNGTPIGDENININGGNNASSRARVLFRNQNRSRQARVLTFSRISLRCYPLSLNNRGCKKQQEHTAMEEEMAHPHRLLLASSPLSVSGRSEAVTTISSVVARDARCDEYWRQYTHTQYTCQRSP
ncbi:uncharacterized protein LOC127772272 [Oryza glaberrima]|uniref:uncharacterized protein LOC127772272 n=1 Tax=Oryza glaberrima TaxID=4538 RepID=UPI00224C19A5|nr:uncharacterized protein LOC127772272 [Oryza glaberrima]